jgi:hypothetical protein
MNSKQLCEKLLYLCGKNKTKRLFAMSSEDLGILNLWF